MNILAISGSLRKDSYNTKLIRAFQKIAPHDMQIELADIHLPLYNEDLESAYPTSARSLKDRIEAAAGLIIATPEYNRSIAAPLKNAIDWLSRPSGENSFAGKPVLVAGVSSGKIGTAVAQSHLKQTLVYLDAKVVGQPELYLGPAKDLFDAEGALASDSAKKLLEKALAKLQTLAT